MGVQWARALELLEEITEVEQKPDVISLSASISAFGKGVEWKRSLELLEEMRERGLKPDVISLSAVISACEKGWNGHVPSSRWRR